jgi:hypothetical protein
MDILLQRYNSPFDYLDMVIKAGSLSAFVREFSKIVGEEKEEKHDWEYWLHKVWEGSFNDFKNDIETTRENQNMSKATILETVNSSMNIMKNFKPGDEGLK